MEHFTNRRTSHTILEPNEARGSGEPKNEKIKRIRMKKRGSSLWMPYF